MAKSKRVVLFVNAVSVGIGVQIALADQSAGALFLAGPLVLGGFGLYVFTSATIAVRRHAEQMALLQGIFGMIASSFLILYKGIAALMLFETVFPRYELLAIAIGVFNLAFLYTQREWMKSVSETGKVPEHLGRTIGE